MRRSRVVAACAATLTASTVIVGVATPAFADSSNGTILGKSVGSVYARSGSDLIRTIAKGGSATFALEVANTGSTLAQYRVKLDNQIPTDPETLSLKVGSQETISLAQSADGYVTAPIAAGKTVALTLKVTTGSVTSANARWINTVTLWNLSDTTQLGLMDTYTEQAASTLGRSNDATIAGPGGQTAVTDRDADSQSGIAGAPAIKVGTVSTFTVKLTNHSAAAAKDVLELYNAGSCEGVVFSTTVKTGTTDVSSAVLAGTYTSPSIAAGKSLTYTIAMKLVTPSTTCNNLCCGYFESAYGLGIHQAADPLGEDTEYVFVALNYAA